MIYEYRVVHSDEEVTAAKLEFLKKGIVLSRLKFFTPGRYLPPFQIRTEMEVLYCHAAAKFQHLIVL